MFIDEDDYLAHYGILRKSGRYPWGSGGPEYASNRGFLDYTAKLKKQGLKETEIAKGMGINVSQLRAAKTIARNEERQSDIARAQGLRDKGYANTEIGRQMQRNESQIRALLAPGQKDRAEVLTTVSNMLRDQVSKKKFVDIGAGVENHLGVSNEKLKAAVALLREEGYTIHYMKVNQLGTSNETSLKVLAGPNVTGKDAYANRHNVQQIKDYSADGGRTFVGIHQPLSISSKRVGINWAEDGGSHADGVIYVRPGVKDISMGSARYAQVRIAIDGTHYLKGMAVYKSDLPHGVDLQFNTNKPRSSNKLDAMKSLKDDPSNPFGAIVRQRIENGKVTSGLNIVGNPHKAGSGEEGSWDTWSKSLSSQFLSKQSPALAKTQLDMTFDRKKREFQDIMKLTNPAVKKKLLQEFSDSADSSAVHLKAAALPRQATKVILPINSLKDTEVYAPTFKNGERVVLVRFPHGGKFEIPELTVNNNHPSAVKLLGKHIEDAIGINSKVAERLSGADFDGDTVLVIPNNKGHVRTESPLEGLKGFDPKSAYPAYPGMRPMSARTKQKEMGVVSNLITDMTIRGANNGEIARAVRHSMVVIDAEKHNLNYKLSEERNGIAALKKKYQAPHNPSGKGGASTLISRGNSDVRVEAQLARKASEGGAIDKATGAKVFVKTGESYIGRDGKLVVKSQKSKKLAETENAHTLSSGTPIEKLYADHSNKLKALANEARLAMINTKTVGYSPSAAKVYHSEVESLKAKLNVAKANAPLERQAQIIANANVAAKRQANPTMDSATLKKVSALALDEARARMGANKQRIIVSESEWKAIQAGAISNHRLEEILNHADTETIKQLATPKLSLKMNTADEARARAMLNNGYTQAEVAEQLGVSVATLKSIAA